MTQEDLRSFLDEKYNLYCRLEFIADDPIQIPHRFTKLQDVEIAGLIAAMFAWGQRKTIINKATQFIRFLDDDPFDFVQNAKPSDLKPLEKFVHRTFNGQDAVGLIIALQNVYRKHKSLESLFISAEGKNMKAGLTNFRTILLENGLESRTKRHLPNPEEGSAAKRLNMYLRWMVRNDGRGVDFGVWKNIKTSQLSCPLDVHTGRVARSLGLLLRPQSDWRAVEELDANLRKLDAIDPVKYDFSLFGLGVYEGFK